MVFLFLTSFSYDVSGVYICKGPQSKKYHYKKDCKGLKNCSTDIYSLPLSDAKNLGRINYLGFLDQFSSFLS